MSHPDKRSGTSAPPNVLFVTGNGHGLGHLTRMLAVANRSAGRFRPVFLTSSQAYPLVRGFGYGVEYLPSYLRLGITRVEWEPLFGSRLSGLVASIEPAAVIIDHINPPTSLQKVRADCQTVDFIWSRRGMWRASRNLAAIRLAAEFDVVVEPRDLAGPIDVGATSNFHAGVTYVPPILLVDKAEQVERNAARQTLGIPANGKAILIQLSDSDPTTLPTLIEDVRDVITSVAGGEEIHLFAPLHPLQNEWKSPVDGVIMQAVYPMARFLRAFDGVVSTAGYNSFHETVASGLPAVVVSRDADRLDDQARRAEFVELCGRGFFAPSVNDPRFRRAVERMLARGEGTIASSVTKELGEFDGAARFADMIATRVERSSRQAPITTHETCFEPTAADALGHIRSGRNPADGHEGETIVLVALGFDRAALDEMAQLITEMLEASNVVPIFLIDDVDNIPLDSHDFQYESIVSLAELGKYTGLDYEQYVRACVDGLRFRYQADSAVTLVPHQVEQSASLVRKAIQT
jgi:hypothetical protein